LSRGAGRPRKKRGKPFKAGYADVAVAQMSHKDTTKDLPMRCGHTKTNKDGTTKEVCKGKGQSRRCIDRNRGGAMAIEHSTVVRSRGVVSTAIATMSQIDKTKDLPMCCGKTNTKKDGTTKEVCKIKGKRKAPNPGDSDGICAGVAQMSQKEKTKDLPMCCGQTETKKDGTTKEVCKGKGQSRRCIDRSRGGATAIEHSTVVRSRGVVSTEFAAQLCEP
jgi:hypothetical protein